MAAEHDVSANTLAAALDLARATYAQARAHFPTEETTK